MDARKDLKEIIYSDDENIRIDLFMSKNHLFNISRSRIKYMIDQKDILVNKKKTKASYMLKNGDNITINFPEQEELNLPAEDIPLNIYYEDEQMMVIDKSAGMIVHPTGKIRTGTLVNAILYHCHGNLPGINGVNRPGIVHRLDKETSGLMMVAKTEQAHRNLAEQIKNRKIVKKYITLVNGVVKNKAGYIEAPIGRDKRHRNKMSVSDIASREAKTYFEIITSFEAYTLLLVRLYTGRTHQIRVHLKFIGYPIVGDKVYGVRKENNKLINIKRQALHSHFLQFNHPVTGELMSFTSDLPEDMKDQIEVLL